METLDFSIKSVELKPSGPYVAKLEGTIYLKKNGKIIHKIEPNKHCWIEVFVFNDNNKTSQFDIHMNIN